MSLDRFEVWIVLYHGHEPNELLEFRYFTTEKMARLRAAWIQQELGCLSTGVTVHQLKNFEATVAKVHKRFGGVFKKLAEED